jgi:hypothetical protein
MTMRGTRVHLLEVRQTRAHRNLSIMPIPEKLATELKAVTLAVSYFGACFGMLAGLAHNSGQGPINGMGSAASTL